jgi:hypothetical protein
VTSDINSEVAARLATSVTPMPSWIIRKDIRPESYLEQLNSEWVNYMAVGFNHMQKMFEQTTSAHMRSYRLTVIMYAILFCMSLMLMVVAIVLGITTDKTSLSVAFGALSLASFLGFFLLHPVYAVEDNLRFVSWLGVAFNNYWTRLMHLSNKDKIQDDLKAAADDYEAAVSRLNGLRGGLRKKKMEVDDNSPEQMLLKAITERGKEDA